MGEAIMVGRGAGSGSNKFQNRLVTEIIESNCTWVAPECINQQISVRIFGGGGGGYCSSKNRAGGGGGFMNNNTLTINAGEQIAIRIGKGGNGSNNANNTTNGGTTSFGTYLSALGGQRGGIQVTSKLTNGANRTLYVGGSGGSGGGLSLDDLHANTNASSFQSGIGYQFGGGGGSKAGSGGYWGGGGGTAGYWYRLTAARGGCIYSELGNVNSLTGYSGLGGNGYYNNKNTETPVNAENGTNTRGLNVEFNGYGRCTHNNGGGGGYGGNGGNGNAGGGGGYGGNGGSTYGGGGGYGANGGNGRAGYGAGGGGGYGKYGDGGSGDYKGSDSHIQNGASRDGGIAAGGGACYPDSNSAKAGNGGNGICIIQYYI